MLGTIKCPNNTGSRHFSYLKKFSFVLMLIVDANYKFLCVYIGGYGQNSDGGRGGYRGPRGCPPRTYL